MTLFEQLPKQTAYNGPPMDTVRGGDNVVCENGHYNATLTRGYDRKKGYYLRAYCFTCKGGQTVYDNKILKEKAQT